MRIKGFIQDQANEEEKRLNTDEKSSITAQKTFPDTGFPRPGDSLLPQTRALPREAVEHDIKELHRTVWRQ